MSCEYRYDIIVVNELTDYYKNKRKQIIEYRTDVIYSSELDDYLDLDNLIVRISNLKLE